MRSVSLFTQSARDESNIAATSEDLTNCYPEKAPGDARTMFAVRSVLGEVAFTQTAAVVPRAICAAHDGLYVIGSGLLQKVDEDGAVTTLANVADGAKTSMAANGSNLAIASGEKYYVWTGSALQEPTGGAFDKTGSVTFMDYDTIRTEHRGRRFDWTETAAPGTLDATQFATAEARDANLIRAVVDKTQLYLFSEQHIEVWFNTRVAGPSRYARLDVIDRGRGLRAHDLLVRDEFGIFFVANDGCAYITAGTQVVKVSTPAIETDIADGTPTECLYYEDRGHKFCAIRFSDRPAVALDLETKFWHRRQTGVVRAPWRARHIAQAWNRWHTLDNVGTVRRLARTNADDGQAMRRVLRSKPIDLEGRDFSLSEFEVLCRVGHAEIGRDAEVMLRVSWDGGLTWSAEERASLGILGDYDTQAQFYALGGGEQCTVEIACTDPTDVVFYSDARVSIT